jgi:hypothetical protein
VQGAANKYSAACAALTEAQARRAEIDHPNALEAARQKDVAEFKRTKKAAHLYAAQHAQDVRDAEQECEALLQLALDAESALIGKAREAKPPTFDLAAESAAVRKLAQTFAMARIRNDVARWLADPSKPFSTAGLSPLEQKLQAVRDELAGVKPAENFFSPAGKDSEVSVNPGDRDWTRHRTDVVLPGGDRLVVSGPAVHADDAEGGIR